MRAAIVLAGGQARRMGGVDKALIEVGGRTMLDRVLMAAAPHCDELVVVGPARQTSVPGTRFTMEDEPGGGPVPAVAAGLAEVPDATEVAVLAVDLPLLGTDHVRTLFTGLEDEGVIAVAAADHRGKANPLLAVYRAGPLRAAVADLGPGVPADRMIPLATVVVNLGEAGTLNVNQPDELERARRLTRPGP
jgi:molybdopterin-guanine dinucleotide biosynthesis protein A